MTELRNPSLPPGEIVEKREDGIWVRNDGVELSPAEKNPYYVLATVFGPHKDGYDRALAKRNRRIWNGWMCSRMEADARAELAKELRLPPEDLEPLNPDEKKLLRVTLCDRLGHVEIPEPGDVDISNNYFSHTAVWEKYVFAGNAEFSSAYFARYARFSTAHFAESAEFSSAHFTGYARFSSVFFAKDVEFSSTYFGGYARFISAHFAGTVEFSAAHFSGNAGFSAARFFGYVGFSIVHFAGDAEFSAAHFFGYARFSAANFAGNAVFSSAQFDRNADFSSALFTGDVKFSSVYFTWDAEFSTAHFAGNAEFSAAQFARNADFSSAHFAGSADFSIARFVGHAWFTDGAFAGATVFSSAEFEKTVPNFFQRSFHDDTRFTAKSGHWPPVDPEVVQQSKEAYRRLRQISAAQHNPENEHFFLRQEMACSAELQDNPLSKWVIKGFGFFSDYGYSVGRPVGWLAVTWLVGALAIQFVFAWAIVYGAPPPGMAAIPGFEDALGLGLANTFAIFGFRTFYFGEEYMSSLPAFVKVIGGAQTVFGFIFLFFLGLGLRNRFRLK